MDYATRNQGIVIRRLGGDTYVAIARHYGISAGRVRQIFMRQEARERRHRRMMHLRGQLLGTEPLDNDTMGNGNDGRWSDPRQRQRGPIIDQVRGPHAPWNATEKEIILADIAFLKQKEIESGAWGKWLKSQEAMGYVPAGDGHSGELVRNYGVITEAIFHYRVGRAPEKDDLDRCNCPQAGNTGHTSCGWCGLCHMPKFMCECPTAHVVNNRGV